MQKFIWDIGKVGVNFIFGPIFGDFLEASDDSREYHPTFDDIDLNDRGWYCILFHMRSYHEFFLTVKA